MSLRTTRRRRLVTDDAPAAGDEDESPVRLAADTGAEAESGAAYPGANSRSSSLERLVPVRLFSIGLVVLAGLTCVGLVELLHLAGQSLSTTFGGEEIAVLNLDGTRNLSHWFASTTLVASALLAAFIYSLRRHRVDDYHGRYRVWAWMGLASLVASGVETADISKLAHAVCRHAATASTVDDAWVWPVAVGALLLGIGLRLLMEVRKSILATAALLLSAAGFFAGAVIERTGLVHISDGSAYLIARGVWLMGYVFILATFLLFARHVTLEIEGIIAHAPRRSKRGKARAGESHAENSPSRSAERPRKSSGSGRTDLDSVEPAAERQRFHLGNRSAMVDENENDQSSSRSPSRAERRRMRRDVKMAS